MIKHLSPPSTKLGRASTISPEVTMLPEIILPWDFEEDIDAGIVGVPFNFHATFQGTGEAPNSIREWFLRFATRSHEFDVDIGDLKIRDIGDIQMHPTEVMRCHKNIEEGLTDLYQQSPNFIPIVFGGNHAIAAPSIRAFRNGNEYSRVGLVDFDAHNDLADPTLQGPTSASMFRQVIEAGQVQGRNAVQIGLHSSMSSVVWGEYAKSVGLREVTAREVWQRGIGPVMDEAMAQAGDGTDAIYVSFDIDAIEDASAPGTGAPAPGGLDPKEAIEAVYMLGKNQKVMALDLVEVDPMKDLRGVTSRMAVMLMVSFLAGLLERRKLYA